MRPFGLKIVTPDGLRYDGQAEQVIVRTVTGDMAVMAGHINCVAPLGMGQAMFRIDGEKRYAACIGGILSVVNGQVHIVATTFEWADDINEDRAAVAEQKARKVLDDKNADDAQLQMAEAKLKRALIRQNVATHKVK